MTQPIFRFAPSPNGHLHLGHAYSALLNQKMAREVEGKLLLRIEDIDTTRCTQELEVQMLSDLEWIGFEWDETPRRQSEHFDEYAEALEKLQKLDLVYPSNLSRSQIKKMAMANKDQDANWRNAPDGSPIYPGNERELSNPERARLIRRSANYALRLDIQAAKKCTEDQLSWIETDKSESKEIIADPLLWGDVIIARKDFPASYHLCCTVDDALQGITHIVRGKDLYDATSIHTMLYQLFDFIKPKYHHHDLILDDDGEKLSKSKAHTSLKELRATGNTASQIREKLGFI